MRAIKSEAKAEQLFGQYRYETVHQQLRDFNDKANDASHHGRFMVPNAVTDDGVGFACSIADELRRIHDRQSIEVTHDGDPTGLFDGARLGQVISNLMGNAIQYSVGSGPVTVTISGKDPRTLNASVHNFGPPIPAESQKTIFQSWMRGQVQDTGEHSHLGLGLYIAKLIVEAHGGEINVASDEARGTTFTIQLPRA